MVVGAEDDIVVAGRWSLNLSGEQLDHVDVGG